MAGVKSFKVVDFTKSRSAGSLGEVASFTITLDDQLTATNGTINGNTVMPTIMVGNRTLSVLADDFLEYNEKARSLTYRLALPEGLNSSFVTLTGYTVRDITINALKGGSLSS